MKLIHKIKKRNLNIEKKYRKIANWKIARDREAFYDTHDFHPYFAAYPPILVHKIFKKFGRNSKTILDPFMGGGSTIIEGVRHGYISLGIDISEFSKFITQAKAQPFKISNEIFNSNIKKIKNIIRRFRGNQINTKKIKTPLVTNVQKWFSKKSLYELTLILQIISRINEKNHKLFFKVCLSSILRKCSNAKNAQQHLNIQKMKKIPDTLDIFMKKILLMKSQMNNYYNYIKSKNINIKFKLYACDVRNITKIIKPNSVDMVVTSPPYGVGSRYTDIYRLHFEFFGLEKPKLKSSLEKNKNFSEKLKDGLMQIYKVMKKNSYFICVYGDPSTVDGITVKVINDCKKIGFKYKGLISCPIEKKFSKHHTIYKRFIPKDFILIFKK
jgi:DNA modification methylase